MDRPRREKIWDWTWKILRGLISPVQMCPYLSSDVRVRVRINGHNSILDFYADQASKFLGSRLAVPGSDERDFALLVLVHSGGR